MSYFNCHYILSILKHVANAFTIIKTKVLPDSMSEIHLLFNMQAILLYKRNNTPVD